MRFGPGRRLFGLQLFAQRHPDGRRHRGAGVAHRELVIRALGRVGKAADAFGLSQPLETVPATRDDLVCIALMAHVPQELVLLEIEDMVQRQRHLDGAEVAGQVATGLADRMQHELANFFRQRGQLRHRQLLQIRRAIDLLQQIAHR